MKRKKKTVIRLENWNTFKKKKEKKCQAQDFCKNI